MKRAQLFLPSAARSFVCVCLCVIFVFPHSSFLLRACWRTVTFQQREFRKKLFCIHNCRCKLYSIQRCAFISLSLSVSLSAQGLFLKPLNVFDKSFFCCCCYSAGTSSKAAYLPSSFAFILYLFALLQLYLLQRHLYISLHLDNYTHTLTPE